MGRDLGTELVLCSIVLIENQTTVQSPPRDYSESVVLFNVECSHIAAGSKSGRP